MNDNHDKRHSVCNMCVCVYLCVRVYVWCVYACVLGVCMHVSMCVVCVCVCSERERELLHAKSATLQVSFNIL